MTVATLLLTCLFFLVLDMTDRVFYVTALSVLLLATFAAGG